MRDRRRLSPSPSSSTTTASRRTPTASLIFIVFFFLIRFIIIIICFSSILVVQALAIPQSQALLKFKESLTNTSSLSNWKQSTHPCSGWSGVRCLTNSNIVWTLKLQGMGLMGRVDVDALVPLPRLRSISLMNNEFRGTFPRFNALGALKAIYISNNKFSGDIPDDAFAGMRSLKKVYLANNEFTGTIPSSITYLSMLLELRIEGNQFRGQIPQFHRKQQLFLRVINVSRNHLSGPIPESLSKMAVTSFSGNENLCGKPLDPCSSSNSKKKKKISWKIATVIMVACIALGAIVIVIAILVIIHSRRSKAQLDASAGNDQQMNSSSATSCSSLTTNDLQTTSSQLLLANNLDLGEESAASKHEDDDDELCFVSNDTNEMRFDLQQLLRAPSEVLADVVGGSFGCNSYKATIDVTPSSGELGQRCMVVKRYNKQMMGAVSREGFEEHMRRLGKLNHPNVLPLTGYYYRKDEKLLLYDFVPNTCSLATYLHGDRIRNKKVQAGLVEWKTRLRIIKGVCRGLQYLYSEFPDVVIPHGHLKSSNVLLQKHHHHHHDSSNSNLELMEPLLTDYALAPVTNPDYIHQLMVAYRSPELSSSSLSSNHHQNQQEVSNKSDIWCLGTLILELLTGKFPTLVYNNYHSSGEQEEEEEEEEEEEIDLSTWVASHHPDLSSRNIKRVLDKEIFEATKQGCKGQMMKLLEIGLSCCEKDVLRRLSIAQVVHEVEELTDHDKHNYSNPDTPHYNTTNTSSSNASVDQDRASAATI